MLSCHNSSKSLFTVIVLHEILRKVQQNFPCREEFCFFVLLLFLVFRDNNSTYFKLC